MAGEVSVLQIGQAIDPKVLPILAAALVGYTGAPFVSSHTIAAGVGGAPDDVTLFNANFPVNARVAYAVFLTTAVVGASTATLRTAAGGAGDALSGAISTGAAAVTSELGTVDDVLLGGSVFLRRTDSGTAGQLLIFWWVDTAGAGTTDLPGIVKTSQLTLTGIFSSERLAKESALGLGVPYIHASAVVAGADVLLVATTPAKSRLAFALVQIKNPGAGASTCTLRNAALGGGDTLATFATDVVALVVAIGSATSTVAGTSLYINKSDAAATMDVCLIFVPVN